MRPSMALLAILGMHPIAAYPIMIASDGVLIPVAVYFTFGPHWEVRKHYYGGADLA
jgi:hypothetical protein